MCDDVDLDRDRALVERCQAGDSAAFGNLYARYYERLLRFCMRRLNDRHESEDAAQEAFARAWKALPNFAGERRFYPWLTVIAGNICTDMLRRRNRSTPTDDLELSAHQPIGVGTHETSEERIIAAVDGELVNKALDRLSVRHRHVLAMREGSGWTYQQIADHEGVEIGTIETLLWRARQALKREFTVLSDSKGALAGFLVGTGALVRRGVLRVAHRTSVVQQSGGGGGGLRNAFAGVAVTSAAVAAALITPHALSTPSHPAQQSAVSVPSSVGLADPTLPLTAAGAPAATDSASAPATDNDGAASIAISKKPTSTALKQGAASALHPLTSGHQPVSVSGPPAGPTSPTFLPNSPQLTQVLPGGLGQVATGLENTVNGLATTLGLGPVLNTLGLTPSAGSAAGTASTTTTTTTPSLGSGLTSAVDNTLKTLLGH
ncbi:MAG TPA: sigma-70 family RNA polymerase sigma factor [Acidimicrobiales bacterium]|nr:sigma-70 family RNA polymerase sigma factor [Acidimicrobiales bacterium]